jgi:hypothetical protein
MPLQIFRAEKQKPVPTDLENQKHPHTKKKKFTAKAGNRSKTRKWKDKAFSPYSPKQTKVS